MTTSTMLFAGSTARRKTSEQCAFSFPNCDCPPFTDRNRPRVSFSAVSTPKFASKYSLESSCRDLQDVHAFAPLRPHYSRKFSSNFSAFFGKLWQFSANFYKKPSFLTKIWRKIFDENLQVNIRWQALDEIYKMYMLLHRSDLNISKHFRQTNFQ